MTQRNPEIPNTKCRHQARCVGLSIGLLIGAGISALGPVRVNAGESGLASIAENEVRRREALVMQAGPLLDEADQLLRDGKSEEAAAAYFRMYQGLPKATMADSARARARAGYAAAGCNWARKLMAEARYVEAGQVLDQVLSADVDPDNAEAKKLKAQFKDTDRYPVALTPEHINKTKQVLEMLEMAHSAYEIGDYDKSRNQNEAILRLDPYNKTARRELEKVERERSRYFEAARDQTRASALTAVDAQWEMPLAPSFGDLTALFASGAGANTNAKTGRDDIQEKMRGIIIPKVDFNEATLDEVVEYLRVRSRDLDTSGRGIDFVVNLPEGQASKQITLYLENVPMGEVVRYVTEKSGATFRVEDRAVRIISLSDNSTQLIPKSYRVPPNFIQTSVVGEEGGAGGAPADPFAQQAGGAAPGLKIKRMGAKEFLETRGVVFKEGASAAYIPGTNMLFVRNTPENIALVDSLVEQSAESAPKQVLISVKMMEVNQTNFAELAFDIGLGPANVPGSNGVFVSGGAPNNGQFDQQANVFSTTSGLRPSGAVLGKATIGSLIDGASTPALDSASPAAFRLLGAFTDPQFQASIRAISQKKGVDLMSVPSVITKSGVKAEVNLTRELIFPTEFEPPEIPQSLSTVVPEGGGVIGLYGTSDFAPVTPSTPTAFDMRKVGITLEVEPVISDDGRKVDLTLLPQSTEFEGFIDYGTDINNPIYGIVHVVQNDILQPVFRTNKLSTGVTVWDGATIVLGGLISENRTTLDDKVPILGDLPILGRLWQGKIKQVERKCILFFVTVKVIDPAGQPIRQLTAVQP